MLMANLFGSITVFTQAIITEMQVRYPDIDIQFIDWEAHSNIEELPNADLIGPTTFTFTEVSRDLVEVNFAIAISTYGSDRNLFRLREYVGEAFDRMRPEKKMKYYDAESASEESVLVFADGTMVAPMTRADRPFQFVQTQALLVPSSES